MCLEPIHSQQKGRDGCWGSHRVANYTRVDYKYSTQHYTGAFFSFVNSFGGCATARRVLEVFGFDYFDNHGDIGDLGFQSISPLGQCFQRVAMSVYLSVCLFVPFYVIFLRPLIGPQVT
jgi:hypothetical protein